MVSDDEIEVSPEMARTGVRVLLSYTAEELFDQEESQLVAVSEIFKAMLKAQRSGLLPSKSDQFVQDSISSRYCYIRSHG
jgi:hypothetical protein